MSISPCPLHINKAVRKDDFVAAESLFHLREVAANFFMPNELSSEP